MRIPRINIPKFLNNEKFHFTIIETNAKLTRNKAYECNIYWEKGPVTCPILFEFRYDRRTDHAGIHLWFHLYRFEFTFDIYDHRHWDYIKDQVEECNCDS